jgi:hypothetical protein
MIRANDRFPRRTFGGLNEKEKIQSRANEPSPAEASGCLSIILFTGLRWKTTSLHSWRHFATWAMDS